MAAEYGNAKPQLRQDERGETSSASQLIKEKFNEELKQREVVLLWAE